MLPFALPQGSACVSPMSPHTSSYDMAVAAAAAAPVHAAQSYALPRPETFQASLPAHILNELASVSSAEQDLAHFARQLMQRKVDLLDNIRRLEQQAAAARHTQHIVPRPTGFAPAAPPTYYKKEGETFHASEPLQATDFECTPPQAEALTISPPCVSPRCDPFTSASPRSASPSDASSPMDASPLHSSPPHCSPPHCSLPPPPCREDALAGLLGLSNAAAAVTA